MREDGTDWGNEMLGNTVPKGKTAMKTLMLMLYLSGTCPVSETLEVGFILCPCKNFSFCTYWHVSAVPFPPPLLFCVGPKCLFQTSFPSARSLGSSPVPDLCPQNLLNKRTNAIPGLNELWALGKFSVLLFGVPSCCVDGPAVRAKSLR